MRSSSLPLYTKCYGALVLPTEDLSTEDTRDAVDWGKQAHAWKETGVAKSKALANALKKAGLTEAVRGELWPSPGEHEVTAALRIDGIRDAVASEVPLYDVYPGPGWVTGTADFRHFLLGGDLWIDDLKTGKVYPDRTTGENRFPQDVGSTQLRLYALSSATVLGYTGVVHVSLSHWPRLPVALRNAGVQRYWTTYTTDELEVFYKQLEQLYQDVVQYPDKRTPGDHCKFCPSQNYCIYQSKETM